MDKSDETCENNKLIYLIIKILTYFKSTEWIN